MGIWDWLRRIFGGGGAAPAEPWPGMGPEHTVSPETAIELLRQTEFSHLAPELEPLMRPAIHLTPAPLEPDDLPMGASRLGGPADLPPGTEWPRREQRPLALLVQLRLSEASEYDAEGVLPQSGLLWFFYDAVEQPWGMGPADADAWRVIFSEAEEGLVRVDPPDDLDEWAHFAPHAAQMRTIATFPSWQTLEEFSTVEFAHDGEAEYYMEWLASITGGEMSERTWLLGWPEEIQGDVHAELVFYGSRPGESGPPDPGLPTDWRLLLQVDSMQAPQWMWGDAGMLYFMIRTEDLAARRFEEVWLDLQCY